MCLILKGDFAQSCLNVQKTPVKGYMSLKYTVMEVSGFSLVRSGREKEHERSIITYR